jgi:hypothetical protein
MDGDDGSDGGGDYYNWGKCCAYFIYFTLTSLLFIADRKKLFWFGGRFAVVATTAPTQQHPAFFKCWQGILFVFLVICCSTVMPSSLLILGLLVGC